MKVNNKFLESELNNQFNQTTIENSFIQYYDLKAINLNEFISSNNFVKKLFENYIKQWKQFNALFDLRSKLIFNKEKNESESNIYQYIQNMCANLSSNAEYKNITTKLNYLSQYVYFIKWTIETYSEFILLNKRKHLTNLEIQNYSILRNACINYIGEFFCGEDGKKHGDRTPVHIFYLFNEYKNFIKKFISKYEPTLITKWIKTSVKKFEKALKHSFANTEYKKAYNKFHKFSICLKHFVIPESNEFNQLSKDEEKQIFEIYYVEILFFEFFLEVIDPFHINKTRVHWRRLQKAIE